VLAAGPGYLGIDRPLGWKVERAEPGWVLVLESWGAFVLVPREDGTTRLIVRTRSSDPATPLGITTAWIGLLVFEPAHFIMERGMLLGVKARAERAAT
jgi:hypothetical protein